MAIRINRVYTRSGDDGKTALVDGSRVPKDAKRVACYGAIDELNSVLGLARSFNASGPANSARDRLEEILKRLQNELFDLGSELATPPAGEYEGMFKVSADDVEALEKLIDACQEDLAPLQSFVLPGGGIVSSFLHLARTTCRRAEREILGLARDEQIGELVLPYVNRLSDLLFVLSRWVAVKSGEEELLWERGLRNQARPKAAKRKLLKKN
jgi:cob(I)alamin adenosyltransferase